MTDLSNFAEEDITRWGEDADPEQHMGEHADEDFEGGDDDAESV